MSLGLAVTITDAGPSAPDYATILSKLQTAVRGIYGNDIYIEPDSKDGQLIALFAQAVSDCNDVVIDTWNQFSPGTATGAGLSSIVKTNGIKRLVPSNSTAPGLVVGQVGTVINNGVAKDATGNLWNLPATVTIPVAGQISVTVTAQAAGAIAAASGAINQIATPTLGWQTFASTSDATPGAPVENDPTLRNRQSVSTALPALTPLGSMQGALENLTGVTVVKIYENYTKVTDGNSIPGNTECVVIRGGTLSAIAQTIGQKKTPGCGTYGTTSQLYTDPKTGIPYTISFYLLADTNIKIRVTGTALTGYTTAQAAAIEKALSDYIGMHDVGQDVEYSGLWAPAYQNMPALQMPYKLTNIEMSTNGGVSWVTVDVAVAFNARAATATTDVTVNIS